MSNSQTLTHDHPGMAVRLFRGLPRYSSLYDIVLQKVCLFKIAHTSQSLSVSLE